MTTSNADIALVVPLRIKAQMARDGIAPNQLQKWWSPDTERDVDPMNDPEVQAAIRHLLSDIWHAHDGTARARCRCGHPKSEHGGPCRGRYCNCEQFEDSGAMTNNEARVIGVLGRFGWVFTEEMRLSYLHNATVYNLINGLVALADENDQLQEALDGSASGGSMET